MYEVLLIKTQWFQATKFISFTDDLLRSSDYKKKKIIIINLARKISSLLNLYILLGQPCT